MSAGQCTPETWNPAPCVWCRRAGAWAPLRLPALTGRSASGCQRPPAARPWTECSPRPLAGLPDVTTPVSKAGLAVLGDVQKPRAVSAQRAHSLGRTSPPQPDPTLRGARQAQEQPGGGPAGDSVHLAPPPQAIMVPASAPFLFPQNFTFLGLPRLKNRGNITPSVFVLQLSPASHILSPRPHHLSEHSGHPTLPRGSSSSVRTLLLTPFSRCTRALAPDNGNV